MANNEQLEKCKKAIADASVKHEKCIKCGSDVVVKSFTLLPGRYTSDGYICGKCTDKEKAAKAAK